MPGRAGRRERAGHREQRDSLALEILAAGGRLRPSAVAIAKGTSGRRSPTWMVMGDLLMSDGAGQIGSADGRLSRLARPDAADHCRGVAEHRPSCPASCCWPCRAWPIRASSVRSSRCASMTRMARSASASATSAPGSAFAGLLKQLEIDPGEAPDCAVHHGGPVEPGRGFVLHSTDWGGQDTLQVNGANGTLFAMTGTIDVLQARSPRAGDRRGGSSRSAMPAGARASSTRK